MIFLEDREDDGGEGRGGGSLLFLRDCTPTFPYCSFTTHDFSSGSFRLCCNLRISDNIPGTAIF